MSDSYDKPSIPLDEIKAEFDALFPHGWCGPDVMAELAPQGWADSPLLAVFHPSPARVYEEVVRMHRNMAALGRRPDAPPPSPEPTLEEITAEHEDKPVEPERECQELVGLCLWDIFSDNHEVITDDGHWLDLGSLRHGGEMLAEILNAQGGPAPPPKPVPDPALMELFNKNTGGGPEQAEFLAQMWQEMIGDGGYSYLDFYM